MNRDSVDGAMHGLWRIDDPLIAPLIPLARRHDVTMLWQLDARLAQVAASGSEPALRQIRMRWWADQLQRLGEGMAAGGEPLLGALAAQWPGAAEPLVALGEAWMACVTDAADAAAAGARGVALFCATADLLGGEAQASARLGEGWGIADAILAGRLGDGDWALASERLGAVRLRSLPRALAALGAVSRAVAGRRGAAAPRRDQFTILRAGLFGG